MRWRYSIATVVERQPVWTQIDRPLLPAVAMFWAHGERYVAVPILSSRRPSPIMLRLSRWRVLLSFLHGELRLYRHPEDARSRQRLGRPPRSARCPGVCSLGDTSRRWPSGPAIVSSEKPRSPAILAKGMAKDMGRRIIKFRLRTNAIEDANDPDEMHRPPVCGKDEGRNGGIRLMRKPGDINIGQVVRDTEGDLSASAALITRAIVAFSVSARRAGWCGTPPTPF